jgi:hypothetical protein
MHARFSHPARRAARLLAVLAVGILGAAAFAYAPIAAAGTSDSVTPPPTKLPASATLESCTTSSEQAQRTATFAGEMSTIPGAAKMEMRIDVLERTAKELTFRTVVAPGLGVWRAAAPGVKVYKYLKQVTNLSAPAAYRAAVRFRWLNGKGKLMKATELKTPKCVQLLHPRPVTPPEPTPTSTLAQ